MNTVINWIKSTFSNVTALRLLCGFLVIFCVVEFVVLSRQIEDQGTSAARVAALPTNNPNNDTVPIAEPDVISCALCTQKLADIVRYQAEVIRSQLNGLVDEPLSEVGLQRVNVIRSAAENLDEKSHPEVLLLIK